MFTKPKPPQTTSRWFSTGSDYEPLFDDQQDSKCTTKSKIITFLVIFTIFLILILLLIFIDWSDDEETIHDSSYWETQFLKLPSNDSCREFSANLAATPHLAAYPEQFETAQYITNLLNSWQFETIQQNYSNTVLSHFVSSKLRFSKNINGTLSNWIDINIAEDIIESDPDTNSSYRHSIWSAYAKTGNVTGNLIYINYGLRSDYEYLLNNLSFPINSFINKIGLVRFGQVGRNIKVKLAEEFGLNGLLIFSDPEQYAPFIPNGIYPNGSWLPPSGIQRGSVLFATCPGNPEINRLRDLCDIHNISDALPSIPVIPISYGTAKLLFDNMTDNNIFTAPPIWQGGIPDTEYKINSTELVLNLDIINELHHDDIIQNVYGIYRGTQYPEQSVMIGAHRDSWVYGAQDDVSGTVTMLEIAKSFATLFKSGWRPKRSIILASWDGEESAVIGSTNFGESTDMEDIELLDGMISYINLDMTTGGDTFSIDGHPLLLSVAEQAMQTTPYLSEIETTYYDIWNRDYKLLTAGSDYEVFAHHVGIVATNIGFKGDAQYGVYHSIYDTMKWQDIVDPNWMKAQSIAMFTGILTMKLLQNDVIPYNLNVLALDMREWFDNQLMDAVNIMYQCNPNGLTMDLMENLSIIIDEFMQIAMELGQFVNDNVFNNDLLQELNQCLLSIPRMLMIQNENDGLPQSMWHKNILWTGAIETSSIQYYPYIWNMLQFNCTQDALMLAFQNTQQIIQNVTLFLNQTLQSVADR